MKKIFSSFLLLVVLSVQSWAALTDNFVSYWAVDEASGNRTDKVVASGNTLTSNGTGGVGQAVGKVYANSGQFVNGFFQYLSRADNASLSVGGTAFTFIVWVYLDSVTGADRPFVGKDNQGSIREYNLAFNLSDNRFEFRTWTGASGVGQAALAANTFGAPAINTWYMIAVTSDQTTNKISVNAGTQDSVSAVNAGWDGAAQFSLGSYSAGGSATHDGRMGPVMFWKRALSAAEITQVYNSGAGLSYGAITGKIDPNPLISGSSTSNTTTYATSSITIHANRLAIASFLVARDAGTAGTTYSLASTGATWHDVANANPYHTVGSPTRVIKQFYTMVSSDQTSALTLTTTNTMDGVDYAVTEFEGVQTGGTDGSAAIVQAPIGNSGGSGAVTLTCSLSAFADATNNVAFGAFGTSQIAGITPESGFVEIHDVTFSTPSNELMTEYKIGQDTSVNATFPAADCGCQAVEIKKLVAVTMSPAIFDDED